MKEKIISALQKITNLKKDILFKLIENPPDPSLGDYSFPCFTLAKSFKKNPHEIAIFLSQKISPMKEIEKVQAVGPYINFFLNKKILTGLTLKKIFKEKEKYGSSFHNKEKIMVEFSQPNTHKAFHIGHIRGTSLGESISRILEFSGNKVIRANYSGDTGMHIAKWLWCYQKYHQKEKLREDESWIAGIYVEAVRCLNEDPSLEKEVEEINRELDSRKNKQLQVLWEKTRKMSIDSWSSIYKELNTRFDVHFFESEFEQPGKQIAQELVKKSIAKISDGATIIDFADFGYKGLGVLVFLRKDGTVLYAGKDLALAERKFFEFNIQGSIYVVADEQNLYLKQIFKTLELMKFKNAGRLKHASYGLVKLPWGKMSSRTGDNVIYSDFKKELISHLKEEIKKRSKISEKETEKRALILAVASLKYAMLKQDIAKIIIFNKEEALSSEGNTGSYLLYTYARARSILRKASYNSKKQYKINEITEKEKQLISKLSAFPEIVSSACHSLAPNLIANYSYELAQIFNEFYHAEKVIGTEEEPFKLALVDAFSQVLKNSLNLLGINTLEQM